ncbi:MAG: multicopper oxidase family protein [Desulfomonilaceae bacterium]
MKSYDSLTLARRNFLKLAGAMGLGLMTPVGMAGASDPLGPSTPHASSLPEGKADVTLRIGPVLVELNENYTLSTIGYNGQVPGPVLRLQEGKTITVDLFNDTDTEEFVHWHGQIIPADVDGAMEEKSLGVPPHGHLRYQLTPRPAGTRWVHTHVVAGANLHRGAYTGQFGLVIIEPSHEEGRYDQEVILATHEWEPFLTNKMEEEEQEKPEDKRLKEEGEKAERALGKPNGFEVGYRLFSINGKTLGFGEPIRVREGQRVLFRILNASATENIELALPGHTFHVIALDGKPVPHPRDVRVLRLGTAERVDALVQMNHPGIWILGTPKDEDRNRGFGIVVEYAGKTGKPRWLSPGKSDWNYLLFGEKGMPVAKPDKTLHMEFGKINGGIGNFNHWTINGKMYEESEPIPLEKGLRYRLAFVNKTDDAHPTHLHRHSFELVNVHGKATSGIIKDVVVVNPFSCVDVDFVADNPGLTLFHCHQTLHMDFGFMRLFQYV